MKIVNSSSSSEDDWLCDDSTLLEEKWRWIPTVRGAGWSRPQGPSLTWPCRPGGRSALFTGTRPSITGNCTGGSPRCGVSPWWPRAMPASGDQRPTRTQCKSPSLLSSDRVTCCQLQLGIHSTHNMNRYLLLLALNEYKSSAIKRLPNILRSQFYVPGTAKFYICSRNVGPLAWLARYLAQPDLASTKKSKFQI